MAKDPAFLFYTSDFLTGTAFMSNEQIGKYIRLLCLQHQHGRLKKEHMMNICLTHDNDIFSKFIQDENGLYYNSRLELETIRRKNYCQSRKENKTTHMSVHMTQHMYGAMIGHMETENENSKIGDCKGKDDCKMCFGSGKLITQHNGKERICPCTKEIV